MKRIALVLLALLCLFTGCAAQESVVGYWESVRAEDMGLDLSNGFIQMDTRLILLEEGQGAWEVEFVESREILRREFSYTLERNQLTLRYPDNTTETYKVSFEDGNMHLKGQDTFVLRRIEE